MQSETSMRNWRKLVLKTLVSLFIITLSCVFTSKAQSSAPIDVLHYHFTVEPDIANKSVRGTSVIRFVAKSNNLTTVEFDCGNLTVDSVKQAGVTREFVVKDHKVKITIPVSEAGQVNELEIAYHGSPKFGIRFFPDNSQVYTIFSTSQWTVCIDSPDDRSALTLTLILPSKLTPISNGRLVSKRELADGKSVSTWEQKQPIPTYIIGFAGGPYRMLTEKKNGVELQYVASGFTDDEVRRIFRDTADMLAFFEDRSGIHYRDKSYAQVLAVGGPAQEMSSFTALGEDYGKNVLANQQDIWLGAHEFAHQWWGNMVTNRDWNHFWLNEGIASFIAAAYLEHRFGKEAYMREINSYRDNYEKVRAAGKDKSLVFPNWDHPTREDRTLVYDKGAYVVHLLRQEMGEEAFWRGLKNFTKRYFGKSVVTSDFEATMQQASKKDLNKFFAEWIHLTKD